MQDAVVVGVDCDTVAECITCLCHEKVIGVEVHTSELAKGVGVTAGQEEVLAGAQEFGGSVIGRVVAVERLSRGQPPVIVRVTRGKAAIGLEGLALQVASAVACLPLKNVGGVGQQGLIRLPLAWAPKHMVKEAWREGELEGLAGQRERLQFTQRQDAAQVVAPVEGAQPLDGAAALACASNGVVGDFRCGELVAQTSGSGGIRLNQISGPVTSGGACSRVASQLVSNGLAGQRCPVGFGRRDGMGDAVLGVGEQSRRLAIAIPRLRQRRDASAVADGRLLEHVAKVINFQCQRVLDARIGRVALVVVGQRLVRVREENRIPVHAAGLQHADAKVLLGDGVGCAGPAYLCWRGAGMPGVIGIGLLAQHGTLESAAGFALFFWCKATRQDRVVKQQRP